MKILSALLCGILFGAGLTIAGMTDPSKIVGFLDLFGVWDPTLIVVMASALAIAFPGFQIALRSPRPVLDRQYFLPERTRIDRDLLLGASLFGIGWGIAGLCPGPAVADLAIGDPLVISFTLAMLFGMFLHGIWHRYRLRTIET